MYWPVAKEISFKDIPMFSCSAELNVLINFGRGHHEEHFCEIILNLDQSFKDISYQELWQVLCLAERNHLCKFGLGLYEEHFCEIILNID